MGYGLHKLKLLHSMKYGNCRNAEKINLLQKYLATKPNGLKISKLI